MVGEDGGFGAGEGVGWAFDEFSAKDLSGASEQLFASQSYCNEQVLSCLYSTTHPDFDNFPKCYLESPF
jgi:hypothetical protein